MSGPSVFISYSHKDEKWKNRLVTHLGVLEREGILDLWEDRRIAGGDDWRSEIEEAINKATVAILLISADFLNSKFILNKEVPKLLERRKKEGVRVIPIIVTACAWQEVKWLSEIQARPKDGKPLSGGNRHQIETKLAEIAHEIARISSSHRDVDKRGAGLTSKSDSFEPLSADIVEKTTPHPVQISEESRSDLNEEKREKALEQNSIDNSLKDTKTSERPESTRRFEQWKIEVTNEAEQKDFPDSSPFRHYADVPFKWSELIVGLASLRKGLLESIKKKVEELKRKADPKYPNDSAGNLPDKHSRFSLSGLSLWANDLDNMGFWLKQRLPELRVSWGRTNGAWEQLDKETDLDEAELLHLQRQLKATNDVITEIIMDLLKSQEQLITLLSIADIDDSYIKSVVDCRGIVKDTIKEFENHQLLIEEMSNFLRNKLAN